MSSDFGIPSGGPPLSMPSFSCRMWSALTPSKLTTRAIAIRLPPLSRLCPGRHADDQGAGERRGLGQLGPLELRDLKALGLDRVECRTIAVAAHHELVDAVHPVLHPCDLRLVGADVLDKHELPARTEHPVDLAERLRLIVDAADDKRRHNGAEGVVGERQLLGTCTEDVRK